MKVSARFDYQTVDHSKDNTVHLLLTVEAPAIDWVAQRPRIAILPVVDISGSMGQASKLEYAKRACKKLVEQLKVGDYSGLVVFDHRVQVRVPPGQVTPEFKTRLLDAIDKLRPDGSTNFSDTIIESLDLLIKMDLPSGVLQRLIFFTDGQPNAGIVDSTALKDLVASHVGARSISFFGYGAGELCDQGLLTELSQRGKGNYAYVENPDDALAAFGRELGGLLSTYASDLRLVIEPRNGHTIEKVVTLLGDKVLAPAADLTELSLDVGDILAEESRHIVLECTAKGQDKALPRDFTLFNVKATWRRITQAGERAVEEAAAAAKLRFVRPEDAQKTPTAEVDEIVSLHQLAQTQREADEEAKRGNFTVAHAKLAAMSGELSTRGRVGAANVATNMANLMGNVDSYRLSQGYQVSMARGLVRSAGVSSYDSMAEADLRGAVGGTFSNGAQAAYSEAFTGSDNAVADSLASAGSVVNAATFVLAPAPNVTMTSPKPAASRPLKKPTAPAPEPEKSPTPGK